MSPFIRQFFASHFLPSCGLFAVRSIEPEIIVRCTLIEILRTTIIKGEKCYLFMFLEIDFVILWLEMLE
jgi:hypothetical protein